MSKTSPQVGKSPSTIFIGLAIDMTWRLAIAILVPVIGGYELDKKLQTSPTLMIIGFIIAMIGMGVVLWQTMQTANHQPVPKLSAAQKRKIKQQYEEDDD